MNKNVLLSTIFVLFCIVGTNVNASDESCPSCDDEVLDCEEQYQACLAAVRAGANAVRQFVKDFFQKWYDLCDAAYESCVKGFHLPGQCTVQRWNCKAPAWAAEAVMLGMIAAGEWLGNAFCLYAKIECERFW